MFRQTIALEDALKIGNEAKNYSLARIKKGYTSLASNQLSTFYYNSLKNSVKETREMYYQSWSQVDPLEKNITVAKFESEVAISSKYSLGNCHELAVLALYYIINFAHNDINAEVYTIDGGDHVFLVLNRDPNSDPHKPETWGVNAVICDPWNDQVNDQVYPAAEYTYRLKNYRSKIFTIKNDRNYVENIDPNKHTLKPIRNFNTQYLCQIRTVDNLKNNFSEEVIYLIKTIEKYKTNLEIEKNRLNKKYGDNDEKVSILANKIHELNQSIRSTSAAVIALKDKKYKNDYIFAKASLTATLKVIHQNAVCSMQFTKEELSKLFAHKGQDNKTEVLKFFGIKSDTYSHLRAMTEEVNEIMKRTKPF